MSYKETQPEFALSLQSKFVTPHLSSSSGYLTNVLSHSNSDQSLPVNMDRTHPDTKHRRLSWPFFDSQISLERQEKSSSTTQLHTTGSDPERDNHSGIYCSAEDIYIKKQRSVSFCPETNFARLPGSKSERSKSTVSAPGALPNGDNANKVFVRNVMIPPDGDWGWTVATGGFFLSFLTLGLLRSYGIVFTSHARSGFYLYSVAHSVLLCSVSLNEYICFQIGPRKSALMGSILVLISYLVSFSSVSLPVYLFTLAIIPGFGTSLCLVATQHIIRQYFYHKRLIALTLSSSGSAAGLLLWPLFLDFFATQYSVPWTFFLVGVGSTLTVICALLYRPALKYYKKYFIRYEIKADQDADEIHRKLNQFLMNDEPVPSQKSLIRQISQLVRLPSFSVLLITVSLSNTGSTLAVYLIPIYIIRIGRTLYHAKLALICLAIGDIVGRLACARCSKLSAKKRTVVIVVCSIVSGISLICLTYMARTAFYATVILTTLFGLTSSNQWNSLYLQTVIKSNVQIEERAMLPAVGMGNLSQGLALILATGLIDFLAETMESFGRVHFLYCMGAFSCIASVIIISSSITNCKRAIT